MSNVVQFLEALSLDPNALTEEQYVNAVSVANFDPSTRDALIKRDASTLNGLLGGRTTVLAFVLPAENEPGDNQRDDDDLPDDGDKETPQHGQETAIAA